MEENLLVGNAKIAETKFGDIIKIGFKESDLELLKANLKNGWVNVDVLTSKAGKPYLKINTFAPKAGAGNTTANRGGEVESPNKPTNTDDLPF